MEIVKATPKQKNILMVDNDKSITLSLMEYAESKELTTKHELSFDIASDAKEALKILSEKKIDLAILDIALPIVNGYFLLKILKEEGIPIVIYTNIKSYEDLNKMAAEKVDNIFIKSFITIEKIVKTLIEKGSLKEDIGQVIINLENQIKAASSEEGEASKLKVLQCPKCKNILSPESHFCNNCGQKIIKETKNTEIKKESPEKTNVKTLDPESQK